MAKHHIDFFDQMVDDEDFEEVKMVGKSNAKIKREIERRREEKELDQVLKDLDWEFDFADDE